MLWSLHLCGLLPEGTSKVKCARWRRTNIVVISNRRVMWITTIIYHSLQLNNHGKFGDRKNERSRVAFVLYFHTHCDRNNSFSIKKAQDLQLFCVCNFCEITFDNSAVNNCLINGTPFASKIRWGSTQHSAVLVVKFTHTTAIGRTQNKLL